MKYVALALLAIAATGHSRVNAEDLSKRDQIHMAVQETCPVSGQRKINPQHWATIHENFARAQRICPVMKHELPANPKWTIVDGQIVFVCCPPCTTKIAAEPDLFLKQVDELYLASLRARRQTRLELAMWDVVARGGDVPLSPLPDLCERIGARQANSVT